MTITTATSEDEVVVEVTSENPDAGPVITVLTGVEATDTSAS